jgi:phosphatidylethanolamine-binding protein (PEBP) family uncharacterized protein
MEKQPPISKNSCFQLDNPVISIFVIPAAKALLLSLFIYSLSNCNKEYNSINEQGSVFKLSSSEIGPDSLLPAEYTCDGNSSTLPLEWSGFPDNTACFALIMHHEASPTDIHWYWVVYNIPLTVHNLPKNMTGIGILGNNSVNGEIGYAPPCSQGPGPKKYVCTVYSLSDTVTLSMPDSEVSRAVLLDAIKDITLANATLTVIYSRNINNF